MSNINYIEIGQRIRSKRKEKGITQEKLAGILGLSRRTIIKWEKGELEKEIAFDKFLELCLVLEIDMPYLLGNEYDNKELETVCKYTGLSPETVKILHHCSKEPLAQNIPAFLSDLFDNYGSVLVFLAYLEDYMCNSYYEKRLSKLPIGALDANTTMEYTEYCDKAALDLLQCHRLIDALKNNVEKDNYIKDRIKNDCGSPMVKSALGL